MDDAFDTIRNHRVRAANGSAGRFPDRYLCPVCQAEVFYAAGDFQSPHFRHRPGSDDDECERRAKNFHRDVPLSQHEYEHLDAVLVATQTSTNRGTLVTFAVRFRPEYQAGFAHFMAGKESTPYTIHSNLRQQYFQIITPEKNYQIKAQLSGRQHEVHIVEGFDETPAVFRSTDRESVRIPNHRVLKPGGYIVVSRKAIADFHADVQPKSLKTIQGLHATLITIPEDAAWHVRQNLQSRLGFEVTAKIAAYAFLSPASAYELAPDSWEIAKDGEVAICIRVSKHFVARGTQLLVQERRSGHLTTNYLTWKSGTDKFVIKAQPGKMRPDLLRVGLAHPVQFLFEVRFANDVISPECARIMFKFASAAKVRTRLTWTAHELPAALVGAIRGRGELLPVVLPKGFEISLSDRQGRRVIAKGESAREEILSFLRSARFPCVLAAAGYPDVILGHKRSTTQPAVHLSQAAISKPCSWKQARLLDAFNRGCASRYSTKAIGL